MVDLGYATFHNDLLKVLDKLLALSDNQKELVKALNGAVDLISLQQQQMIGLKKRIEDLERGSLYNRLRPLDPNDGAV